MKARGVETKVLLGCGPAGWGHGPTASVEIRWCPQGFEENACASFGKFLVRKCGAPWEGDSEYAADLERRLNRVKYPVCDDIGRALPHMTKDLIGLVLIGAGV